VVKQGSLKKKKKSDFSEGKMERRKEKKNFKILVFSITLRPAVQSVNYEQNISFEPVSNKCVNHLLNKIGLIVW